MIRTGRTLRFRAHTCAAFLLAAMAAVLCAEALHDSPTVDEPNHLVRGLAYWWAGDTQLSNAHPPLANALQALPAAVFGAPIDLTTLSGWRAADIALLAKTYLGRNYAEARAQIVWGRFVTIAIALALALYLYVRMLRYGRLRALVVLLLYVCNPIVLAHGHLLTTDLPIVAAYGVTTLEFARYLMRRNLGGVPQFRTEADDGRSKDCEEPRRRRTGGTPTTSDEAIRREAKPADGRNKGHPLGALLVTSLGFGCALATKFSALLLLPPMVGLALYWAIRRRGRFAGQTAWRCAAMIVRDGTIATVIALLAINAAYRFQRTGWSIAQHLEERDPRTNLAGRSTRLLKTHSPLRFLPPGLRLPLPHPYVFGIFSLQAKSERGHGGYFLGRSHNISAAYFPIMLVVKNPASLLALWVIAAVTMRRRRLASAEALVILVIAGSYLAIAMTARINLGVRHVLPAVVLLLLPAGRAAVACLVSRRRFRHRLALALGILLVAETAVSFPNHLSHMSWLIGGDRVGHRISIMGEDWGQDVVAFGRFARARNLTPLYYEPYGAASQFELTAQNIEWKPFTCRMNLVGPAWIARHAANDLRFNQRCGPIARGRKPDIVFANHIHLFRIEAKTDDGW